MNFEKDDVVKLSNGAEYIVVDIVNYNYNKYLYLSSLKTDEIAVVRVDIKDGSVLLSKMSGDEYYNVLKLLTDKNSNIEV